MYLPSGTTLYYMLMQLSILSVSKTQEQLVRCKCMFPTLNVRKLASTATDIGPTLATAICNWDSFPAARFTLPLIWAMEWLVLYLHDNFCNTNTQVTNIPSYLHFIGILLWLYKGSTCHCWSLCWRLHSERNIPCYHHYILYCQSVLSCNKTAVTREHTPPTVNVDRNCTWTVDDVLGTDVHQVSIF